MKARVIAVANQKGGVGKTTTAVNLAASLAADGRRVLLIDTDPQGNASCALGVDTQQVEAGVYDALLGEKPLASVILTTEIATLWIAPSHKDLAGAAVELLELEDAHGRMRGAVETIRGSYEYVLIDCPPSLDLLTINALTAADSVLVPVQCEYYAMEGLTRLMQTIDRVRASLNAPLAIEGIVFTMYDGRNTLAKQVIHEVRSYFKEAVFETLIPRNVRLSEAPSFGKPCLLYDLASRGSQSYIALARELDARRKRPERRAS